MPRPQTGVELSLLLDRLTLCERAWKVDGSVGATGAEWVGGGGAVINTERN